MYVSEAVMVSRGPAAEKKQTGRGRGEIRIGIVHVPARGM